MKTVRLFAAVAVVVALVCASVRAQEPARPGPEHDVLKKWEGTWDATMKVMGMEFKGVSTYKMELGGLWLASAYDGEIAGTKFQGRGFDSYDAGKRKYVALWVDSMSASPMVMEGTFDKDKRTMTMTGDGPGPDGKPTKWKGVSEWKDDDTVQMGMYVGDAVEPMFTILYKRKK